LVADRNASELGHINRFGNANWVILLETVAGGQAIHDGLYSQRSLFRYLLPYAAGFIRAACGLPH
jgi:hypothetical protein